MTNIVELEVDTQLQRSPDWFAARIGKVTVTHLPTMISARAFDQYQRHAREAAMACVELMVEQSRLLKCQFPERVATSQDKERGE